MNEILQHCINFECEYIYSIAYVTAMNQTNLKKYSYTK